MTLATHGQHGRVAGKTALVTGAASGIGRATALLLAEQGAAVVCADLNAAGAEETATAIAGSGRAGFAHRLDVTSESDWQTVIDHVLQADGRLDIVVNSAGISDACPVAETTLDHWRRVVSVNLEGILLGTKHAVLAMRRTGVGGSIVNVASVSGVKAQAGAAAYCASKAAAIMLSKTAALECRQAGDKIRINCVSPTGVKTPMWRSMPFFQELVARHGSEDAAFEALAADSPQARWALPEEVASAILYLASDESSFVTGTNLLFDNGDTA